MPDPMPRNPPGLPLRGRPLDDRPPNGQILVLEGLSPIHLIPNWCANRLLLTLCHWRCRSETEVTRGILSLEIPSTQPIPR